MYCKIESKHKHKHNQNQQVTPYLKVKNVFRVGFLSRGCLERNDGAG